MSLAFQDEFTKERGVTFFVSVEPVFSEQVSSTRAAQNASAHD